MQTEMILPMRSADDLGVWERLDDVIMGGQSDSALRAAEAGGEGTQGSLAFSAARSDRERSDNGAGSVKPTSTSTD